MPLVKSTAEILASIENTTVQAMRDANRQAHRTVIAETLLSTSEAAALCRVSSATIRKWEAAGVLECTRTKGGHRRYSIADLRTCMQRFKEKENDA